MKLKTDEIRAFISSKGEAPPKTKQLPRRVVVMLYLNAVSISISPCSHWLVRIQGGWSVANTTRDSLDQLRCYLNDHFQQPLKFQE